MGRDLCRGFAKYDASWFLVNWTIVESAFGPDMSVGFSKFDPNVEHSKELLF